MCNFKTRYLQKKKIFNQSNLLIWWILYQTIFLQSFSFLPDNACAKKEPEPQVEKATDERSEPSSSSDKSSKSGVGNDFSSDEAKESEGDSDPAQ